MLAGVRHVPPSTMFGSPRRTGRVGDWSAAGAAWWSRSRRSDCIDKRWVRRWPSGRGWRCESASGGATVCGRVVSYSGFEYAAPRPSRRWAWRQPATYGTFAARPRRSGRATAGVWRQPATYGTFAARPRRSGQTPRGRPTGAPNRRARRPRSSSMQLRALSPPTTDRRQPAASPPRKTIRVARRDIVSIIRHRPDTSTTNPTATMGVPTKPG